MPASRRPQVKFISVSAQAGKARFAEACRMPIKDCNSALPAAPEEKRGLPERQFGLTCAGGLWAPGRKTGRTGRAMAQEAEVAAHVEALLEEPVAALGYQLLEVQYRFEGRWVLRLIIDREQGVNLDDCGAISELAGRVLDVEDPVPNAFSLEVSSPGVFRPLRQPRHFRQSIGKMVRFNLLPGVMDGRKEKPLRCRISGVLEERLLVEVEGETLELPLDGIRSARLDPDL